jgi:hypothetical protein
MRAKISSRRAKHCLILRNKSSIYHLMRRRIMHRRWAVHLQGEFYELINRGEITPRESTVTIASRSLYADQLSSDTNLLGRSQPMIRTVGQIPQSVILLRLCFTSAVSCRRLLDDLYAAYERTTDCLTIGILQHLERSCPGYLRVPNIPTNPKKQHGSFQILHAPCT